MLPQPTQDDPFGAILKKYNYTPPAQSGQPQDWYAQVKNKVQQNTVNEVTPETSGLNGGPAKGIASFIGGEKLAEGLGQAGANASGVQDEALGAQDNNMETQSHLIQTIKDDRAAGKDTSRLEAALKALTGNIVGEGNQAEELGTGGLTNKEVLGSAVQLGADFIPGAGEGASLLEKSAVGAGTGYTLDVGNKLQDKNKSTGEAFIPGAGTVVGATLPFAGALVGALSKKIAGFTAGTGEEAIQRAIDNPDAVGEAVSTYAKTPEAKQTLVDKAKASISSFIQDKQEEYGTSLNNLGTDAAKLKETQTSVVDSFTDNVKKFGGSINDEGELAFKNSTLTPSDQTAVKQAWNTVHNWDDTSPKGLDSLRQAIGNHMDEFSLAGNSRANVILGKVQDSLKGNLSENLPGYSDMLSTYAKKSQLTKDLVKELQLGGAAKPSTQLNNVMKIFQKDPSLQDKLVDVMGKEGSEKFLNDLSGAILSDWAPQGKLMPLLKAGGDVGLAAGAAAAGGGAAAIPVAAAGAASMSPRIVGTVARTAGRFAKSGLGKVASRIATMGAASTGK